MNGYYCLNCGEKLKQLSMNLSTDKYECPKCCTTRSKGAGNRPKEGDKP